MPFKKGQSGNPRGRQIERETAEVRTLARRHTPEAVKRLVHWMRSDNPKASVMASTALLDRGWGRPSQTLEVAGQVEVQDKRAIIDDIVRMVGMGSSNRGQESPMPALAAPVRLGEDERTNWGGR